VRALMAHPLIGSWSLAKTLVEAYLDDEQFAAWRSPATRNRSAGAPSAPAPPATYPAAGSPQPPAAHTLMAHPLIGSWSLAKTLVEAYLDDEQFAAWR
jgi:hypothetical protein